jgi:hypothetical protein
VLVWGDPGHASHAAAFFGPILRRVTLPEPEPGAPNPYRFAPRDSLRQTLAAAGFREVDAQVGLVAVRFPGTAAALMRWYREAAIPMDFIWERLGPEATAQAVAEIIANLRPFEAGGAVRTEIEVVAGTGVRSAGAAPRQQRPAGRRPPRGAPPARRLPLPFPLRRPWVGHAATDGPGAPPVGACSCARSTLSSASAVAPTRYRG